MWILEWLPNWIFYAILFLGLIGFLITYLLKFIPIPAIYMYKAPIQIVSVIMIVIGVYMAGSIANNEAWEAKVKEVQSKLAEAEARGAIETVKIVEKVVVQQKVIKERGKDIVQYVDREVVKFDNKCEIPPVFVEAHNKAAEKIQ
jgi:uncharacterized membrane protein